MRASLWIAWRELTDRKVSFVMAVAAMALVVALCSATELVSRAREIAVSAEMDQMGPGIRLVPAGVTAADLARLNVGASFLPEEIVPRLGSDLANWIRATEVRLLLVQEMQGLQAALIGVEPEVVVTHADMLRNLGDGKIVIGSQLAERLTLREGSMMQIRGSEFRVTAVLPSTATTDDLAVFMPLRKLQELAGLGEVVSEIRLYPLPGDALEKAQAFLKSRHPDLKVIIPDRDDAARIDVDQSLQQHRWAVYLVMACIAAFCVLIWAHLNAGERRVEMATIVAVGGSSLSVFAILALRASIVGLVGALFGYLGAAVFALIQDYQSAVAVVFSGYFLAILLAGTVSLSVIGALPVLLVSALREHVTALQE